MTPDLTYAFDETTLSDIEFWSESRDKRQSVFEQLRAADEPQFFTERGVMLGDEVILEPGPGFWAITRHADVVDASRHPELFCSGKGSNIADLPEDMNEFFGSMINMDDPRHARMRRVVSRGFTPRMLSSLEDQVQSIATRIVDDVSSKGSVDFVSEVAARLPLAIICDMMGIPDSEYDTVFHQTNVILSAGDPEYIDEDANVIEALLTAGMTLAGLMTEIAQDRRANPTEDLTSALLHAEVEGETLTDAEIASFFILLCAAGNETTRNGISHGMKMLTDNPEQRALLVSDLDTYLPGTIEEIVRLASPVIHFRRTCTTDGAVLAGRTFNEGDKVVLWYNSANRDSRIFDDPHTFSITRDNSSHVGFGGPGPHFCLGAHLARREMNVMFRELLTRLPDMHATGEPAYLRSNFINGIKHLNVEFTPVG